MFIEGLLSSAGSLFFEVYFCPLTDHEKYMQRCLHLARMGAGSVAPNPMVGAVLVHDEKIIGEGYHQQYGQPHAEVNCINSVDLADQPLISKSTLYVSLEPCSHFGKTPPCVDKIIENKIPKVVIGCKDSYAEVNGKGIVKLEASNINVITGILEKQAIELNKRFFNFHQRQRPYIILKWAQSNNNMIAGHDHSGVSISNDVTNRLVHQWRSEEAAIMVGTNTALKDDPALTTRLWAGKNPIRLVIDRGLKLPSTLHLFDSTVKTIVFNQHKEEKGEMLYFCKITDVKNLAEILNKLYQLQVQSVLVEGGTVLLQSFIDAGLWDEARIITNTSLNIENGLAAPVLGNADLMTEEQLLDDHIAYFTK